MLEHFINWLKLTFHVLPASGNKLVSGCLCPINHKESLQSLKCILLKPNSCCASITKTIWTMQMLPKLKCSIAKTILHRCARNHVKLRKSEPVYEDNLILSQALIDHNRRQPPPTSHMKLLLEEAQLNTKSSNLTWWQKLKSSI